MQKQNELITTQYFVDSARLLVRLPMDGEKWFYITPQCKVSTLLDDIKREDTEVIDVNILNE